MEVSLLALMTGIPAEGAPQVGAAPVVGFDEAMMQALAETPPGVAPPPNLPATAGEGDATGKPIAPAQSLDLNPQISNSAIVGFVPALAWNLLL